jgi:hypothetical protein
LDRHIVARLQVVPVAFLSTQWLVVRSQKSPSMHWLSLVQVTGQLALPPQRYGVQDGVPPAPAPRIVQAPFPLAPREAAHTSQAPPHAELQQNPSAQAPLRHWSLAAQLAPWLCFSTQAPLEQ